MRLKKIKLAGFKSFVDPTTLEILSPLVGIVGPNGCGKSNVIDAVRWVMGESSAKNLRGESMSDVIFNGSTTRKPVGQATIELVFDNADGSLGGEYASYAEISIRRQAGRDNQSDYFLNGTRCRRRDITDIFLGTGLGPRSYAIIEQGMISRVIESKPDDLRAFFEEAAGISIYRRRRHETETRMRHTRENLSRLEDIRQELEKQLERLKRQSESAERYQLLKVELETLEAELAALRWHLLKEQQETKRSQVLKLQNNLEEKRAGKASIESELEKLREQHVEKNEEYNKIHGQYYEIGTQIARTEQTLEHHQEKQTQLEQDLASGKQDISRIEGQIHFDKQLLADAQNEWQEIEPQFSTLEARAQECHHAVENTQDANRHFDEKFEQFQSEALAPQKTAEVEKARIEQLDRQSREANAHFIRLEQEQTTLNIDSLNQSLHDLEDEILGKEQEIDGQRELLDTLTDNINELRLNLNKLTQSLDESKSARQTKQGRLASLEALQQAALGKTEGAVKEWLKVVGSENNPRLGEIIEALPGFERAIETVLGEAVEAVFVEDIEKISENLSNFTKGHITLFEGARARIDNPHSTERLETQETTATLSEALPGVLQGVLPGAARLLDKIRTQNLEKEMLASIQQLLGNVQVVEDLPTAMALRHRLKSNESLITRDGIWIGLHWLRVYHDTKGHGGVLEREAEIKQLTSEIEQLNSDISTLEQSLGVCRVDISNIEEQRETALKSQQEDSKKLQELTNRSSAIRTRVEHARNRFARIQEELATYKQRLTQSQEEAATSRLTLQTALNTMEENAKLKEALLEERTNLKSIARQAETELKVARDDLHRIALKREHLKAQLAGLEQGIHRLEENRTKVSERIVSLETALRENIAPYQALRESLDELLEKRLVIEEQLNHSRSAVEALDNELQILEKRRQNYEQEANIVHTELDEARMEQQALEIRSQTVEEKLVALGKTAAQIWETMPKEANESDWTARHEQVNNKISRLGAINLAAIEEYQSESERKNYLDSQHLDLTSALETLENAIKKIDRETRAKFKETFDKVNSQYQILFPKLFGGGQAYLELIGEDLLEAGVAVMARPPGKRNSSIHLLSGGEKALTAVALVFAIFQLNPAPFCMLDEVDAPLDDANVGRFCELVKHMSSSVQFIYITHNKVTMEMAHHLVGVTMKEPGVSRLVTVDVAEAYEMATA